MKIYWLNLIIFTVWLKKKLNNYEVAIDYFLKAQEYYAVVGNELGVARTNFNIGRIFITIRNQAEAKLYLSKVLNSGIRDDKLLRKAYQSLAYSEENDSIAAQYLFKALELSKQSNDIYIDDFIGLLYNNLGYRTKNKAYRRKAIEHYKQALAVAKKNENRQKNSLSLR